jgi:hypothetical protein
MKASPWGARLMALPSTSECLGATDLRPSRGRHASSGSFRLFAAMQDIWVSLHSIQSRSMLFRQLHRRQTTNIANFSYDIFNDLFIRRTFQDLAGYPRILGIVV